MEPEASQVLWQNPIPFQLMIPKEYDGLVQKLICSAMKNPSSTIKPPQHPLLSVLHTCDPGHIPVGTSEYVTESVCWCSLCIRLSEFMKINSCFCK